MIDFFLKLFDTSGFPARWHCGNWTDAHGWLHILSDLAVFGAYAAIPFSITSYIVLKKQEVIFPKLYWLFAGFILSCGITHLVEATIFWHPWYRFSGIMKLITAIVSWVTVIALIRILPDAMKLPGQVKINDQLKREMEERIASAQAMRESSTRLALAMAHTGLGDWSWEPSGNTYTLSERAAEILGIPSPGTYGWDDIIARIHEADRQPAEEAFHHAIKEHADYDNSYRLVRPNGEEVWASARGRAEYGEDGRVLRMVGTLADITERKNVDKEREQLLAMESAARKQAEDANRMKDEFLAILSHELRSPLNAILGWANILRADHSDPAELALGLEVIERNTLLQAKLVEDLLDMSRIISGKVRLDVQMVDISRAINAALDSVRPMAESKNIRITSVLDPLAGPVRGDPARLQQIMWNLLTNAVKFTSNEGKIQVTLERVNSHIEINVCDNGLGIAPDFLPHVFDRFRQADSSTIRKHGGLGLGLSLVKNLTEMHGGTVHAKSAGPGQGSTFRVILPLPLTHGAGDAGSRLHPAASDELATDTETPDLTGSQVLAVDDEVDSLDLIRRLLEGCGAKVTTASSGHEALQKLEQSIFDVLISDIGMPEMDGFELISRIRALAPDSQSQIPAIALTAFARSEDRRRAMTAGFDSFLSKPVETSELLAVVYRCVTRSRQLRG